MELHATLRRCRLRLPTGLLTVALLGVALLASCAGGDGDDPTAEPPATPAATASESATTPTEPGEPAATDSDATSMPDPAAEAAREIVESVDLVADEAFLTLNDLAFPDGDLSQADIVPGLAPLLDDEDPGRRWAALYVVALVTDSPGEIAVLLTVLEDPEPIFRVHAAGSLAGLGEVDALPALIAGLELEGDMPYSDPPLPVADHARMTLEHYTGQAFSDVAGWQAWWEQVGGDLTWDGQRYASD